MLISRYIGVIPLMADALRVAMQIMSGAALKKAVHNAMIANVGAATRPSHLPRERAALRPPFAAPPSGCCAICDVLTKTPYACALQHELPADNGFAIGAAS
jgi:hypothetical protein